MQKYCIADLILNMSFCGSTMIERSHKYQLDRPSVESQIQIESKRGEALQTEGCVIRKSGEQYTIEAEGKRITFFFKDKLLSRQKIAENNGRTVEIRYAPALDSYKGLTFDELESSDTCSAFSNALLEYEGVCFHASAIVFENTALLFSAPSGTGKSTHTRLWQQCFGKAAVQIINDDRPAIRRIDGRFRAYGTPWSGSSPLNINTSAPLGAIVFLKQGTKNTIRKLSNREALKWLLYQAQYPKQNREKVEKLMDLLEDMLMKIAFYELTCNVSDEAVHTVYQQLRKDKIL